MRPLLVLATLVFASSARAQPAAECPLPVRPGVSIGAVRLGMTLAEAKATGSFVEPGKDEAPVWRAVTPAGNLAFRVGKDKRVEEITLESSKPCLVEGTQRVLDLAAADAQRRAPYGDCGGQASGMGSGWICEEHGILFWWKGDRATTIVVQRPTLMAPFKQAPPPMPKAPPAEPKRVLLATVPGPAADAGVAADGGPQRDGGVALAAAPVDPCEGNWPPAPGLACGFFGRNETLTLECYPTAQCMGSFAKSAPAHVCVHGANGEVLGALAPGRGGRTLALKFGKPMPVGTPLRVYFDRDVRVLPPANSYLGPQMPTDPARDPKVVGIAASWVVGSRPVSNGWVLDLQVPASAGLPAATVERRAE